MRRFSASHKRLAGIAVLVLVLAAGGTTFAAFSSQKDNTGNSVETPGPRQEPSARI